MTQPTTTPFVQKAAQLGRAEAQPAQPPKMSDEQMRLECAKLAVQAHVQPALLIETAKRLHDFVKSGTA
jgi:hypothetical protein